jgi:hypothetical protein
MSRIPNTGNKLSIILLALFDCCHFRKVLKSDMCHLILQRTGPPDPYGPVGGGRANSMGRGMDELDFSDDEAAPLTEPIYNGR